jgi:spore germination protein GerM
VTTRTVNVVTVAGLLGLLALLAFTAPRWARWMRQPVTAPDDDPAFAEREEEKGPSASAEKEGQRTISVKLYFESPDLSGLLPEDRSLPFSLDLSNQLRTVVEELVKGSQTGLVSPLPDSTKVLDVFVTAAGVAFVSLSKEVAAAGREGSMEELLTVYSIVNSITANFPAVKRVQLLLDDRPVTTLAGHVDVSRPLPPDMTFVAQALATPPPSPAAALPAPAPAVPTP